MKENDITFLDPLRQRSIPVRLYLPAHQTAQPLSVAIFSPGYQGQEELNNPAELWAYLKYQYLAEFFTQHGYAFVTIQHDMAGDTDGLETIDPTHVQHEARRHLYVRGEKNIMYVIQQLERQFSGWNWQSLVIGGHSNGGDIAKYFANQHPERISHIIAMDARRCRLEVSFPLKLLMFEASDTTTDPGVLPDPAKDAGPHAARHQLEWVVIKPRNALHASYSDSDITDDIKNTVLTSIKWFLQ